MIAEKEINYDDLPESGYKTNELNIPIEVTFFKYEYYLLVIYFHPRKESLSKLVIHDMTLKRVELWMENNKPEKLTMGVV